MTSSPTMRPANPSEIGPRATARTRARWCGSSGPSKAGRNTAWNAMRATTPIASAASSRFIAFRSDDHRHDHGSQVERPAAGALGGDRDLGAQPIGVAALLGARAGEHRAGRAPDLARQFLLVGRDAAGDDVHLVAADEDDHDTLLGEMTPLAHDLGPHGLGAAIEIDHAAGNGI